jgi:hypothetical protein
MEKDSLSPMEVAWLSEFTQDTHYDIQHINIPYTLIVNETGTIGKWAGVIPPSEEVEKLLKENT